MTAYPKYVFSEAERNELLAARALSTPGNDAANVSAEGNWVPFYRKLSEILGRHIEAGTAASAEDLQDFKNVKLWMDVAIGANAGTGVHSTFIRNFTNYQGRLRLGREFTEEEMQKTSNGVALNLYLTLIGEQASKDPRYERWTIPTISQLAGDDAASIGRNLYHDNVSDKDDAVVTNTGWSGTLGFNLLGGSDPFESWRLLSEPARDGDMALNPEMQRVDTLDDMKNILFAAAAYSHAFWAASKVGANLALAGIAHEFARLKYFSITGYLMAEGETNPYFESLKAQFEINRESEDWLGLMNDVAGRSSVISPVTTLIDQLGKEKFLDMLRGAYEGQALIGQTKEDGFVGAAHAFFKNFSPDKIERIAAELLPASASELVVRAKSDIDVRNALQALSLVSVDVVAAGLDTDALQMYNPATRTGTLTESWLEDRAQMVEYMTSSALSLTTEFHDKASGLNVVSGVPEIVANQVIFGSAEGERITGQFMHDRLYGGAGDDILDGSVGNDYLEGGLGKDTYMLSTASNSGIDTIFDADGQGVLSVNGTELTNLAFQRPNIPIADGNVGEAYYSADSLYRLREGEDGWEFAARTSSGYRTLALLQNWQAGDLGITLDTTTQPGVTPETAAFELDHRNSSLYTHYIGNNAPQGIWVHGSTQRASQFTGSNYGDVIYTGGASNIAYGYGGNDYIRGGDGRDYITAGINRSDLTNDDDIVYGGGGTDIIAGGGGHDTLWADDGSGNYEIESAASSERGDWITGQYGSDRLYGSAGQDILFGGEGDDTVHGGAGNDLILGDAHYLTGSSGVGLGSGSGFSAWRWDTGSPQRLPSSHYESSIVVANSTIYNWQVSTTETDYTLTPGRPLFSQDRIQAGTPDSSWNDTLHGGAGNDWIAGQKGDDTLYGGDGDDILYGDDSVPMPGGAADEGHDRLNAGQGAITYNGHTLSADSVYAGKSRQRCCV